MSVSRPERILIVDDSQFMRYNIKKALTKAGFSTFYEATHVLEAIQLYKDEKPDLVTMDITMPAISGIEGLKMILREDPNAKIIMVSAAGQKKKVIESLQSGAKHFVVKPFQSEELISIINSIL